MWRTLALLYFAAVSPVLAFAQSGTTTVAYPVQSSGYVSAVVRDASGSIVRTAFTHRQLAAGTHTYVWDGFDDEGTPAPNGTYTLQTVWAPGFRSTFRAMTGTSLGLGQMPGNHRAVESLAIGDSAYLLLASRGDATSPAEICLTKDGTAHVAEGEQFDAGRVAATTGATTDAPGETDVWYNISATEWSEAGILRKNFLHAMDRRGVYKCEWNVRLPGQTSAHWVDHRYGISAIGDVVAVCYTEESLVRFFDCTRQASGPAGVVPAVVLHSFAGIVQPVDLCLETTERFLVTTASSVRRYDRSTGQLTTVVAGLSQASSIDVNRSNGEFYVVVNGGRQVQRYSAVGVLLATYGVTGARDSGPYDPLALGQVLDIASDQAGSFWISDEYPRRVALFRDDGTHVRDRFGPQQFYNATLVDPLDRQRLWMETSAPAAPDFPQQAGLAFLDGTLDRTSWTWSLNAVRRVPRAVAGDYRERWQCRVINGVRYFTLGTGFSGSLIIRENPNGELILTNVFYGSAGDEAFRYGMTADEKARVGKNWNFVYTNSRAENTYAPADYQWSQEVLYGWEGFFDDELNFYFWDRYGNNKLFRIARTGWNNAGAPTYGSFASRQLVIDPATDGFPGDIQIHRWLPLSTGGFAALIQDESLAPTGSEWPDSLSARWWLARFGADGRLVWKTGTKNTSNIVSEAPARTGTLCVPRQFCGEINGCIVVADQVGTPALAYTLDGICVGSFLDGRADDGLPNQVYTWWDIANWSNARLVDNPLLLANQTPFQYDMLKGGNIHPGDTADDVLWLPHGRNNTPVFSVSGWSGWSTQDVPLVLNRSPVAFNGAGLTARYYASADWSGPPTTRIDPDLRMWFMRDRGPHQAGSSYATGDVVSSAGTYYFCVQGPANVPLTNAAFWYPLDSRYVNPAGTGWYRAVNAPGASGLDQFTVSWSGQLVPFHTGTHWFVWEGDAAEIWINGVKVIDLSSRYGRTMTDAWADCRQKFFHKVSAPVELVSGQPVPIAVRMRVSSPVTNWPRGNSLFQERFSPRASLSWCTEGFSVRPIDAKYLVPAGSVGSAATDTASVTSAVGGLNIAWSSPADGGAFQIWRGIDRNPKQGALIATTTSNQIIDSAPPANATVTYWIRSAAGQLLAVSDAVTTTGLIGTPAAILNLSTRGAIDSEHPMIMGFVTTGEAPADLLVRAVGPGLAGFGVADFLPAPRIDLNQMGNSSTTLLATMLSWGAQTNATAIASASERTGAFGLANGSTDAAALSSFAPGIYTAVIRDIHGASGVALAEIYVAGSGASPFRNLSTRGNAGAGGNALIAGFFLDGTTPQRLLLRGLGPAIAGLGVTDALGHPTLHVFRQGQDQPMIENAGWWMVDGDLATIVRQAEAATGAFALAAGSDDAAVVVDLGPGAYTVHLRPAIGTAPGNALIELYVLGR